MKSILKVIAGSFGIILALYSGGLAYCFIFEVFATEYLLFWFIGSFLVGFLMFGLASSAFKKPFFFLIPLSTVFSGVFTLHFVLYFQLGIIINLPVALTVSTFIRKYYFIKEGNK